MNDKTYNGWTNHPTWRVNLEIFDGHDLRDVFETIPDVYAVAQWAREHMETLIDETGATIAQDYAHAFLADVDWHMIASHLIENASEVDA